MRAGDAGSPPGNGLGNDRRVFADADQERPERTDLSWRLEARSGDDQATIRNVPLAGLRMWIT
jgi:hypothetical protein